MKSNVLSWGKLIFAAAVILFLIYNGSLDVTLISYALSSPGILLISFLLLFAGLVLGGFRWWLIMRSAGVHFKLIELVKIQLIAAFFSTWLPGAAGGDAAKGVYIFRSLEAKRTTALVTVVIDRFFSLFGLIATASAIIWASVGYYIHSTDIHVYSNIFSIIIVLGIVGCVVIAVAAFFFRFPAWKLPILRRIRPFAHQLRVAVQLLVVEWPMMIACAAISVFASGLVVVGIVLLASTFPFAPEPLASALAGVIGNISSAIPLTPGGLGIGEAAFAHVVNGFGAPPASYATIYLTFRLLMLLVSLSGAFFWLTRGR